MEKGVSIESARTIAVRLMDKYDLFDKDWKFAFDNARRRLGLCSYRRKTISLSKNYLPLVDEAEVIDTVLHEIAHALVGKKQGHNWIWKQKAVEIGCNGQRLYKGEARVEAKYVGTCPKCGRVIHRHRRKKISCSRCDNVFRKELMFVWTLNEE